MVKQSSLYHIAAQPWQYIDSENILHLAIRAERGIIKFVSCLACDPCDTRRETSGLEIPRLERWEMNVQLYGPTYEYFTLQKALATHKLRYHFEIHMMDGEVYFYDAVGLSAAKEELYIRPFFVAYTYVSNHTGAPKWAGDTVWYQIFPDRFCKAKLSSNDGWDMGTVQDRDMASGGDLNGIADKIPYLKSLGITGIYLNPIFKAASVHRYDTIDYYTIDPLLGTKEDFIRLCDICHKNGIRVMLDGVFNHCSHLSKQFQDVLRNGESSKYYKWFVIHDVQQLMKTEIPMGAAPSFRENPAYETFAFVPSMPKWNTANPDVMEYLIGTADYWTRRCHIDAWRLDVPDEINIVFLRRFRNCIKEANPDIYIIGEFWSDATPWLNGEVFDGAMDYPLYFAVRDFLALKKEDAYHCAERITQCIASCPEPIQRGMFRFCSTHDIPRILWHCKGDHAEAQMCYTLMAALGGGISIYYGDEVGVTGGYDPDNRRCFPWHGESLAPKTDDITRQAITWKQNHSTEAIRGIYAVDCDVLCVEVETVTLAVNRSASKKQLPNGLWLHPKSCQDIPNRLFEKDIKGVKRA